MERNLILNRRAFTLIELLVVMAIIAIFAAILFPVFQNVCEDARAICCESNLKQMGMALVQYSRTTTRLRSIITTAPGRAGRAIPPLETLLDSSISGWTLSSLTSEMRRYFDARSRMAAETTLTLPTRRSAARPRPA